MAPPKRILGPSSCSAHPGVRVGSALSPLRISRIQSLADAGYPASWHDLLNELRQKDTFLHSLLQTRETALLSKGWAIVDAVKPGEKEPTPRAQEVAAYCRWALSKTVKLERALAHLLDGVYKGYAVCETVWAQEGEDYYPAVLEPIDGWRFSFSDDGQIRIYDDGQIQWPGIDFQSQWPYKFVVHQPRVNGDSPQREGLGRVLCWYSSFRSWAWRDLLLFAELFGKPIVRVVYDRDKAQNADEADAQNIVNDLTSTNRAVHSKALDVIIEWAKSTGASGESPCSLIIDKAGAEMALATIGQQQTTADVTGGLGAKGDTRDLVRKDITRSDGVALGETLRDGLLGALCDLKYGTREDCPYFVFHTDDSVDSKSLFEAMEKGVGMGMKVPVSYAHEITGWPVASDGEDTLGAVATAKPVTPQPEPVAHPDQVDPATGPTGPAEPAA